MTSKTKLIPLIGLLTVPTGACGPLEEDLESSAVGSSAAALWFSSVSQSSGVVGQPQNLFDQDDATHMSAGSAPGNCFHNSRGFMLLNSGICAEQGSTRRFSGWLTARLAVPWTTGADRVHIDLVHSRAFVGAAATLVYYSWDDGRSFAFQQAVLASNSALSIRVTIPAPGLNRPPDVTILLARASDEPSTVWPRTGELRWHRISALSALPPPGTVLLRNGSQFSAQSILFQGRDLGFLDIGQGIQLSERPGRYQWRAQLGYDPNGAPLYVSWGEVTVREDQQVNVTIPRITVADVLTNFAPSARFRGTGFLRTGEFIVFANGDYRLIRPRFADEIGRIQEVSWPNNSAFLTFRAGSLGQVTIGWPFFVFDSPATNLRFSRS